MEIKLPQPKLATALNYTARAVSNKPNIPVLSNVLLEVNKTQLHLAATNLDMGINMWIPGQVNSEGSLTVSGKFLTDFISATGDGNIVLKLEQDTLQVMTERAKADFQTIPSQEFPILPQVVGTPLFTANSEDLCRALTKVIFACASDLVTSRIQYTGVLFELKQDTPDMVTMVGLDGYRLSRKQIKVEGLKLESDLQLIVPARSLQEVVKILQTEAQPLVEVYLSENKSQVIFKIEEIEISIRLLEGPYVDYHKVIPSENAFTFSVSKSDLEKAMKVVHTFARSTQGYRVDWDLDLESTTLIMKTTVSELGSNQFELKVEDVVGSNDFKAAYSLQFLLEMAGHMGGDNINFATNGPLSAAVFTDSADTDFLHIIMPLQRDDI